MERQLPEGLVTAAEELPKVTRKTRLGLVCLFSLAQDTAIWASNSLRTTYLLLALRFPR